MTGLYAGVGAVAAFFGARALVNWYRQRSYEQPYRYSPRQGMMETGRMDTGRTGSNIPAETGAYRSSMPQEGVTATGMTEVG